VKKSFFIVLFCKLFFLPCVSQITRNDVDFAFYLFEGRKFDEVILLFNQKMPDLKENASLKDSINYILGMTHYYRKELDKSAYYLSKISKTSVFYDKSVFFTALDYAHLSEYTMAQTVLENYSTTKFSSKYDQLLAVELAGLALLKRDFELFDRHAKKFKFDQYYYSNSQNQLLDVRKTLSNHRPKSPAVAGLLSAVVPGAGKVYAGQIGEGIAAFLTVGSLAAITAENWSKNGLSNWKTITFGTLCSIFYIGNIYGSVASVKVYRNQFNDKQNHIILLSIHLPVRALFE